MDGVQIDAPDAAERMDDHLDAADAAADAAAAASKLPEASALRVAALGARGLTAMATGDASAAAEAADAVVAALRRDEDAASVRSAADGPHGAAVAAALKTAAHWIALTGVRVETGTRRNRNRDANANAAAKEKETETEKDERKKKETVRIDAHTTPPSSRSTSRMICTRARPTWRPRRRRPRPLARRTRRSPRMPCSPTCVWRRRNSRFAAPSPPPPDAATIRIADAEEAAASAVTAAESLGDPNHPRVALAVACSADVYVAKAVLAAKGGGGTGDGAGVMFAEGLYRNALRMLGTPRHPTATADDPDAASGGAARSHLRLAAALAHARYAAVLRASGANRAAEAEAWAAAAAGSGRDRATPGVPSRRPREESEGWGGIGCCTTPSS